MKTTNVVTETTNKNVINTHLTGSRFRGFLVIKGLRIPSWDRKEFTESQNSKNDTVKKDYKPHILRQKNGLSVAFYY